MGRTCARNAGESTGGAEVSSYYQQCKCGAYCQEEPCYDCLKAENKRLYEVLMQRPEQTELEVLRAENARLNCLLDASEKQRAETMDAVREIAKARDEAQAAVSRRRLILSWTVTNWRFLRGSTKSVVETLNTKTDS